MKPIPSENENLDVFYIIFEFTVQNKFHLTLNVLLYVAR